MVGDRVPAQVALSLLLAAGSPAAAQEADAWRAFFDGARVRSAAPAAPAAPVQPKAGAPAPLNASERSDLAAALDTAARAAKAWPGYDALAQPLLIVRPGGRALLIGHPNPPADFQPVAAGGRTVYVAPTSPDPGFDFRLGYDFGGAPTNVVVAREGKADDSAALFVHERFHQYQREWKNGQYGDYALEDAEDLALATVEQQALARAIENPADAASAAAFLGLREARYAHHPEIRAAEDQQERDEGTARYVEASAGGPAAHYHLDGVPAELRRAPDLDSMEKGRYYATGAGIGVLLDRSGTAWKPRVVGGESPFGVLSAVAAASPAQRAAAAAAVKASPEYAAALSAARADVASAVAERRAALARFEAQPGVRVRVMTAFGQGEPMPEVYEGSRRSYRVPGGMVLDPATQFVYELAPWKIHLENVPVFMGQGMDFDFFAAAGVLVIDGRTGAPATGAGGFSSLRISDGGIEVSLGPGIWSYDGRVLVLKRR